MCKTGSGIGHHQRVVDAGSPPEVFGREADGDGVEIEPDAALTRKQLGVRAGAKAFGKIDRVSAEAVPLLPMPAFFAVESLKIAIGRPYVFWPQLYADEFV